MDQPDAEKPIRLYLFDQRESILYHLAYFDEFLADWYAEKKMHHWEGGLEIDGGRSF